MSDAPAAPAPPSDRLRWLERGTLGLLIGWLVVAALVVDVELYDGLDSLCVARFFTGGTSTYVLNRGPLVGLLLVPADLLGRALGLHPLDVRPAHLVSAALHTAYLVGCLRLLQRAAGRDAAALIAFVAAVPTFLFFSYGPFLSHDLAAGGALLWLLVLVDEPPSRRRDVALVAVGAAAALLKHTFAIFLIAIVLVEVAGSLRDRARWPGARRLIGLSAIAGVITWLVLCAAVGSTVAELYGTPWLLAPLGQIRAVTGIGSTGPWWVFPRHIFAFGVLPALLLVPAWMRARGGSALERRAAWVAVLVTAVTLALPYREVRYLSVLSPTLALLIVPVVRSLLALPIGRWALAAALLTPLVPGLPYSVVDEAVRLREPFYQHNPARALLASVDDERPSHLVFAAPMLTFLAPAAPLAGDRYHRWFHLAPHHVQMLYGYPDAAVTRTQPNRIDQLRGWPAGTALFIPSHGVLYQPSSWGGGLPPEVAEATNDLWRSRDLAVTAEGVGPRTRLQLPADVAGREIGWAYVVGEGGVPVPVTRDDAGWWAEGAGGEGSGGAAILRAFVLEASVPTWTAP